MPAAPQRIERRQVECATRFSSNNLIGLSEAEKLRIHMSQDGIAGLRASIADAREVLGSLGEDEWHQPSAAEGWSVLDVALHMGDLLDILMSAVRNELVAGDLGIERLNNQRVTQKRMLQSSWELEEFDRQSQAALKLFGDLQAEPFASTRVPFLDLGTYPLHLMPDVCAFDFYTHLRWDILSPRGPLQHVANESDEVRLKPSIGWLLAGLSQMQPGLGSFLTEPLRLTLGGPGGGDWDLVPTSDGIVVAPHAAAVSVVAEVESTTHLFTAWATTRLHWREHVTVNGDQKAAAAFLDALNLV
ncbi:maleylpyruvate isomerase N-terminal domain-containing protein [Streptomyces sp. NPDC001833]|uniref:maleylpyruvate isomerase N-terminal domain-containing protein n=1 Tax=Streptomyces sp. NPDC001833 TaxID=3154658 RepID=UPI00331A2181